jgi:hypothetical protein
MNALIDVLGQVPATAWAALVAAVVTALITLTGVALTNRSSNQRLRMQLDHELQTKGQDFQRERLEELYLLVEGWVNTLFMYFLPYARVMRGDLTFNQALDITIDVGGKSTVDFKRIEMIIDLYFPELRTDLDRVHAAREAANKIIHKYKKQYETGDTDGRQFLQPFLTAEKQVETEGVALKAKIIQKARETYNLAVERTR